MKQDLPSSDVSSSGRKPLPSPSEVRKLPPDGGPEYNRLIFEQSPYLLQHASNPVDWYPWGEQAFDKAKAEDKPIFLSIGYTTCHWCHVMEHESFEDDNAATLMNQNYVCVKVDREERPDVDNVYMSVTQMMTGQGGWPMTIIMTPDKVPFFAGTYFPTHAMLQLLPHFASVWKHQREKVFQLGTKITSDLARMSGGFPGGELDSSTMDTCQQHLASIYDTKYGGFGSRPKFPTTHNLSFLLRHYLRTKDASSLQMVENTLEKIRQGGVYDHVGLGIHRYSTDARWILPHFEKMLYDQALFVTANLECYQITQKAQYAQTASEVLTYVTRDMTSPEGGFYSAEDADSEGEEGKFYVWTTEELHETLGEENAKLFARIYNCEADGNFRDEATHEKNGSNIPYLHLDLPTIAAGLGRDLPELEAQLTAIRETLFSARETRIHPQKDDKILTDWNGLMISAFAQAGRVLDEDRFLSAATRAADHCLTTLRTDNGRLLKRSRNGQAGLPAHLEDYAFLIQGLLDLYEATFVVRYLREATSLADLTLRHFLDTKNGGLFQTADDGEQLLVRAKSIYDGAIPSGNSVMALNLLRLAGITESKTYESAANGIFNAFAGYAENNPIGCAVLMTALDFAVGPSLEIVIAGEPGDANTEALIRTIRQRFIPNKVLLFRPAGDPTPEIAEIAPFVQNQGRSAGPATAYVCRHQACELPVHSPTELEQTLAKAMK